MNISIIIPTLNESASIGRLLDHLLTFKKDAVEVIVVDGGSSDNTVEVVSQHPEVQLVHCDCSRAKQMNHGASMASHDFLYFIHSDTLPPKSFMDDFESIVKQGYHAGSYRSKFENGPFLLRLNAFFTRFKWLVSRGGDQSLFICRKLFRELGGFDENMKIMEEYPFIKELMRRKTFAIIPKDILISTRKYDGRSWLQVSRANYIAFKLFKKGESSDLIQQKYKELLH